MKRERASERDRGRTYEAVLASRGPRAFTTTDGKQSHGLAASPYLFLPLKENGRSWPSTVPICSGCHFSCPIRDNRLLKLATSVIRVKVAIARCPMFFRCHGRFTYFKTRGTWRPTVVWTRINMEPQRLEALYSTGCVSWRLRVSRFQGEHYSQMGLDWTPNLCLQIHKNLQLFNRLPEEKATRYEHTPFSVTELFKLVSVYHPIFHSECWIFNAQHNAFYVEWLKTFFSTVSWFPAPKLFY